MVIWLRTMSRRDSPVLIGNLVPSHPQLPPARNKCSLGTPGQFLHTLGYSHSTSTEELGKLVYDKIGMFPVRKMAESSKERALATQPHFRTKTTYPPITT